MLAFVALSVVGGYAEAIGIALFLPLLSQGQPLGNDLLSHQVARLLVVLHLPASTVGVLPVIVFAFLLKGLLAFAAGAYQYAISSDISAGMRRSLVIAVGEADYRHLLATNSGTLANVVSQEVTRATSAFLYFTRLIPLALNILLFFGIVAYLNWRLTLAAIITGGLILYLLKLPTRLTERYSTANTEENNALSQLLIQTLQANKYLRATNSFPRLQLKIDESVFRLAALIRRIGYLYSFTGAVAQPLVVIFPIGDHAVLPPDRPSAGASVGDSRLFVSNHERRISAAGGLAGSGLAARRPPRGAEHHRRSGDAP